MIEREFSKTSLPSGPQTIDAILKMGAVFLKNYHEGIDDAPEYEISCVSDLCNALGQLVRPDTLHVPLPESQWKAVINELVLKNSRKETVDSGILLIQLATYINSLVPIEPSGDLSKGIQETRHALAEKF